MTHPCIALALLLALPVLLVLWPLALMDRAVRRALDAPE